MKTAKGSAKKGKAKVPKQSNVKKSRKEIRKAKRQDRKAKRNEFFSHRKKTITAETLNSSEKRTITKPQLQKCKSIKPVQERQINVEDEITPKNNRNNHSSVVKSIEKEKKVEKQLKADMQKIRSRLMVEANWEEDKNIKKLEKQLKLNKRKSKTIPKTFANDGLDYLLEVCDSDNRRNIIGTEMDVDNVNDDFDEDFNLMMGNSSKKQEKKSKQITKNDSESEEDNDDFHEELSENEDDFSENISGNEFSDDENLASSENEEVEKNTLENDSESEESDAENKNNQQTNESNTWEDIYGRLRDKDGNVITSKANKYIPPAARAAQEGGLDSTLLRLKRQLKGLINRLAESNMHNISSQIETLYNTNSRHNMNETLAGIMFENIIVTTPCPERLLLEHVLLVTILHANVGSEVGAFFLQSVVHKFCAILDAYSENIEDKRMDNAVNFIAQLYNFKLFSSQLLYEVLTKLAEKFEEKHVECILNVLKNVGFTLRKDDPLILKNLIQNLQGKAASDMSHDNPRIKFMLDILLAIKNNNVNKIPNYDTSYSEHLKKMLKSFIRKGNYVTQLNISLDDLLKADEQGKWWVVGSAWAGKRDDHQTEQETSSKPKNTFSQKLVALAKKQHMNTDARMNIFCILMSAEDYMDAFEKLLHLGLKNQQEREIINVLLHCCLSEKKYNPYYSVLAQKFCDYDRKFQMIIKCSIWDKLQTLVDCSPAQISNLAKLLTHLFLEKGLPISTLKIVRFGELDKVTLRFMRQILLGVMLTPDVDTCQEVFLKVCHSDNLKMFRESLRLFIHHFLLRNLRKEGGSQMDEGQKRLLEERAGILDKLLLSANDRKRKLTHEDG